MYINVSSKIIQVVRVVYAFDSTPSLFLKLLTQIIGVVLTQRFLAAHRQWRLFTELSFNEV